MIIKFSVPVNPIPQQRPRVTKNGVFEPARCTQFKRTLKMAALAEMHDKQPLKGEVACLINVYRNFEVTSQRFGDSDNHAKSVMDAINGVCYSNDSQVTLLVVGKHKSKVPRVEVLLTDETTDWKNLISFTF